jgi:hypothetical protein
MAGEVCFSIARTFGRRSVPGEDHATDDDLESYMKGHLTPAKAAEIELHMLECKFCRDRLSRTVGLSRNVKVPRTETAGYEQRSEPRFPAKEEAILQRLNPLTLERHIVEIVDVSQNGLGIWATTSLFPGTLVQIRSKDMVRLGEVLYCSLSRTGGYRIGVQLHISQ